ncbi:MAG: PQQ-binding-like beta-propeller repeat protein, partial [Candidatus Binatia bacterium]
MRKAMRLRIPVIFVMRSLLASWLVALLSGAALGADHDWPMYGRDLGRTAFNGLETKINRTSVAMLIPKWVFHAGDSITASPVVINFDHFGPLGSEPTRKVVYVGSADENFYAVDAASGTEIWRFKADPAPTIGYNMFVSSAFVDKGNGRLYVGGGFTMYALDLFTGALMWKWSTANYGGGEIESSPLMARDATGDTVYFGTDLDGAIPTTNPKFPAVFALDAATGALKWFWRPSHIGNCGDVWASVAADLDEKLLYFATSDCSRSHQGLYNEAVIALGVDPSPGSLGPGLARTEPPNWYFQPRDIDPYDYDFGSTPILFDAAGKKYVGIGGKDGSYYVLERQRSATPGVFRATTWDTRVVRGGFAAGFIGGSATDG